MIVAVAKAVRVARVVLADRVAVALDVAALVARVVADPVVAAAHAASPVPGLFAATC